MQAVGVLGGEVGPPTPATGGGDPNPHRRRGAKLLSGCCILGCEWNRLFLCIVSEVHKSPSSGLGGGGYPSLGGPILGSRGASFGGTPPLDPPPRPPPGVPLGGPKTGPEPGNSCRYSPVVVSWGGSRGGYPWGGLIGGVPPWGGLRGGLGVPWGGLRGGSWGGLRGGLGVTFTYVCSVRARARL